MGFFDDVGDFFEEAVDSAVGALQEAWDTIARIPQMIADAIAAAIDDLFRVPLDGIMTIL